MPLIFAGGEGDSFTITGLIGFSQTAGRFNAAWADGAFQWGSNDTNGVVAGVFDAPVVTAWLHFEMYAQSILGNNTHPLATLFDDTGQGVARIIGVDTGGYGVERWDGAAWQLIGSVISGVDELIEFDLMVTLNASVGIVEGFLNQVSIARFDGDTSGSPGTTVTDFNLTKASFLASNDQYISQIIGASESTIGWNLQTLRVDADGTETDWEGGASPFLNINEIGLVNTAEIIESGIALEISTFSVDNPTALGVGKEIKGVVHAVSLRNQASGPQNAELVTRSGGVNHFHGNLAIGTGYTQHNLVLEDDPFTGSPWLIANVDVMQPGLRSNA